MICAPRARPRPPRRNVPWRNVGQFDPGENGQTPGLAEFVGHPEQARDDQVEHGAVGMVGDGDGR